MSIKPVNSQSYTNKDFRDIFEEQLAVANKLSDRWDPSQSNESDPGVVLLKENAIIGDKLSYNMDTNILELFPNTVSQENIARNLFSQLGYTMSWYKAAMIELSLRYRPKEDTSDETTISIPAFSQFSDADSKIIYTTIEPVIINNIETQTVRAIQGIPELYQVNGSSVITLENLDTNNRLYFTELDIAENGIFISDKTNSESASNVWTKVNNLAISPLQTKIYKFGVEGNTNNCYIEFPDDISNLIGEGLEIRFMHTLGSSGNVALNTINKLYVDIPLVDNDSTLTTDNLFITNSSLISRGEDPEDINSAIKNYEKTVGVFNTLVTLRDYENYIYESNLASNVLVFDRTNDPQHTYKLKYKASADINDIRTDVVRDAESMNAFSLKVVALNYVPINDDMNSGDYNNSFSLESADPLKPLKPSSEILDYIESAKSAQHDFIGLNAGLESDEIGILYFINRLPLNFRILTNSTLSIAQQQELRKTILEALYKAFNAHEITFGQGIAYNDIYNTVLNSSSLIKGIFLDDFKYITSAVYCRGDEKFITDINNTSSTSQASTEQEINDRTKIITDIYAKSVLAGTTPLYQPVTETKILPNTTNITQLNKVEYIEGTVNLSTNANNKIELRANEGIIFKRNSLIVDESFTFFRYKLCTDNNIEANTEYTFGQGEGIFIFFRESDESNRFTQVFIGNGATIKATASLTSWSNTYEASYPALHDLAPDATGKYRRSVLGVDTQLNNELARFDLPYNFSGKQQLDYLVVNMQKLIVPEDKSKKYKYYWVTPNVRMDEGTGNKNYELTFNKEGDTSTYTHELSAFEYFFVANEKETTLDIFGAGSLITAVFNSSTDPTITLTTPDAISLNNIETYGFNAFNANSWMHGLATNTAQCSSLVVTEQEFISLSTGDSVTFQKVTTSESTGLQIGPSYIDLDEYEVEYSKSIDNSTESTGILYKDGGWKVRSILYINSSPDAPQKLLENQTVKLYLSDSNTASTDGQEFYLQLSPATVNLDATNKVNLTITYDDGSTSNKLYANALYYKADPSINKITFPEQSADAEYIIVKQGGPGTNDSIPIPTGENFALNWIIADDKWTYVKVTISANSEAFMNINSADNYLYAKQVVQSTSIPAGMIKSITETIINLLMPTNINKQPDYWIAKVPKSFDFSSVPSLDMLIQDPTSADSFFNKNHVYNNICIGALDTNDLYEKYSYLAQANAKPSISFNSIVK